MPRRKANGKSQKVISLLKMEERQQSVTSPTYKLVSAWYAAVMINTFFVVVVFFFVIGNSFSNPISN